MGRVNTAGNFQTADVDRDNLGKDLNYINFTPTNWKIYHEIKN